MDGKNGKCNIQKFQCLINGTLSFSEFSKFLFKVSCQQTRSCRHLLRQQFYRPMSLLSISNVSSFSLLPLRVGKLLFTDGSIVPRATGVRFLVACSPPPHHPELHKTNTIRKHWNWATTYAETKHVPQQLSEIDVLECRVVTAVTFLTVLLVEAIPVSLSCQYASNRNMGHLNYEFFVSLIKPDSRKFRDISSLIHADTSILKSFVESVG